MKDSLGDRMKQRYESRAKQFLQRGTYTLIRIDGKAFRTYTRRLEKPFDFGLVSDMQETTRFLCENIQGCKLGYTQSDEISLLLIDFDTPQTDAWFDGQVQKMVSVSASLATGKFNELRSLRYSENNLRYPKLAFFDSRVFQISQKAEVMNYFRWRQKDAVKNSISMVAQSLYSQKELHGKNGGELQELIFQKGKNWNDFDDSVKRGSTLIKRTHAFTVPNGPNAGTLATRSKWEIETTDYMGDSGWDWLDSEIPD